MLQIVACMDPYAVEIHRNGKSIAVIRWHGGTWRLDIDAPDGWRSIPFDVLEIALRFRDDLSRPVAVTGPAFPCSVCRAEMGWDRPSGVCSSECLQRGQETVNTGGKKERLL